MGNPKPQFAVTRLQFHVAEISNLARRSVQFSTFLFSQNIIQYEDTYRNCKVAIKGGREKPEGL